MKRKDKNARSVPTYRAVHTLEETLAYYDHAIRMVAAKVDDPEDQEIFDLADLRTRVLVASERAKLEHPELADRLRLVIGGSVSIGFVDPDGETVAAIPVTRCPGCAGFDDLTAKVNEIAARGAIVE